MEIEIEIKLELSLLAKTAEKIEIGHCRGNFLQEMIDASLGGNPHHCHASQLGVDPNSTSIRYLEQLFLQAARLRRKTTSSSSSFVFFPSLE